MKVSKPFLGNSNREIFEQAYSLFQSGNLTASKNICERIVKLSPNSTPAVELYGIILLIERKYKEAAVAFSHLTQISAKNPNAFLNLGVALNALGKVELALQSYNTAISINPRDAKLHFNRANCFVQLKRFDEAIEGYRYATKLKDNYVEAHANLGSALIENGSIDEAITALTITISLDPTFCDAYFSLGKALCKIKKYEEAIDNFDRSIELFPSHFEALSDRGLALQALKQLDRALASYDKAIAVKPDFAEAHNNRGNVLKDLKRLDEALASYDTAIALNLSFAEAHSNRADILKDLKRLNEAMASYDTALAIKPDYSSVLWNQADLLLLLGNFERGLKQYEHRGSRENVPKYRRYVQPQLLDAELLKGKTLFVHHELYFGDMIQFSRYALLAEEKGAKVIISAQNSLHDLLCTLSPSIEIIQEKTAPISFNYHIPLLSLPLAFQTVLETIPRIVPYLHSESDRVSKWRAIIGEQGFKIGICWQGSKLSKDNGRSLPLTEFLYLSKLPGVRLISLQKYDGIEQLETLPDGMNIETLGEEFDSGTQAFLDTAAVLENLDLIITCDTAIAHLAGALARPTWVALKYVPDWRWLLDREDSPWYPTLRLFRQDKPHHWRSAFEKMELAISELLQSKQIGGIK